MIRILWVVIGLSAVLLADFSKVGNIIIDSETNLQWQDNETVNKTWMTAINYCETLNLDGYSDWRLPNINELTSLVNDSRNPAISDVFEHKASGAFWSSTTYTYSSGYAYYISFGSGYQRLNGKGGFWDVRCVRGGR